MDDQYSGNMIVGLMRAVDKVVPSNRPTVPIGDKAVFILPSEAELDRRFPWYVRCLSSSDATRLFQQYGGSIQQLATAL